MGIPCCRSASGFCIDECASRSENGCVAWGKCSALICGEQGVGSFLDALLAHLVRMRKRGFRPPSSSRSAFADWVSVELASARLKVSRNTTSNAYRANKVVERPSPKFMASEAVDHLTLDGRRLTNPGLTPLFDGLRHIVHRCGGSGHLRSRLLCAFGRAAFFPHLPHCVFPRADWTMERVLVVLRHFCDGTSPGVRGISIGM